MIHDENAAYHINDSNHHQGEDSMMGVSPSGAGGGITPPSTPGGGSDSAGSEGAPGVQSRLVVLHGD